MPKTVAPTSHDAIKRSLKSKFKLILSENRILVETINGYVRKAEKVYKEMESTDDVTPKQFAKAMEKLERAYSACVRLIMVASDLFEKGDSDGMRARDTAASSCESETSMYSSESSTTITDSNRGRKIPNDKTVQRRSKSSDVRVNEGTKVKAKTHAVNQKSRTIEVADTSMVETANAVSERLFVRPGSSSDFDHLIELQRFLHGLEKEKLQTDHPSPCIAVEKQLISCKIPDEKMSTMNNSQVENRQESPKESISQSLTQRLKILKSAIEHFKDRSLGDERVTQALNDIRELVLRSREPKENRINMEGVSDMQIKEGINSQVSPVSDSMSTETRTEIENKLHRKERDHADNAQKSIGDGSQLRSPQLSKVRKTPDQNLKLVDGSFGKICETDRSPSPSERILAISPGQQQNPCTDQLWMMEQQQVEPLNNQQTQNGAAPRSPANSILVSESEDKEDINQILVNRIVDMVSAKLAPRLQVTKSDEPYPFRSGKMSANNCPEDSSFLPKCSRSPTPFAFKEVKCPQNDELENYCGNYNNCPQSHRQHYQQQLGPHQYEMQKCQRRQLRPKMVSFVEDYEEGTHYSTWNSRVQCGSRHFHSDSSPTSLPGTFLYEESDKEPKPPQSCQNNPSIKFGSPNKKRTHIPQPISAHRYSDQYQQQKQTLTMKHLENEDGDAIERDVELDKDDDESERMNESDSDVVKEQLQYKSQDHLKSTHSHESVAWVTRPTLRSPSLNTEYRNVHQTQRGQLSQQQQQASHKNDSFVNKFPMRSPSVDIHYATQNNVHKDWAISSQQLEELSPVDGGKVRPSSGDAINLMQYRILDKTPKLHLKEPLQEWAANSTDEQVECVHISHSPKTIVTHTQKIGESVRPFPTKAPRSTSSQPQLQNPIGCYNNFPSHHYGFEKLKNIDCTTFQTSESSCDVSPALSTDDRLNAENITNGRDDQDDADQTTARPEVVCINALQLQEDASRTITLSNLPLDLDETELLNLFKKYGQVTKIYYIKDRNTGLFQGRAYGKFSKASEAYQAAQDLQKLIIDGQEICVQLYVNTP